MSNLIYNGNFSLPLMSQNNWSYISGLTSQEQIDFYWTIGNSYVALHNGITVFGFSNPALIFQTQFISIQYTASISQIFTVSNITSYILTFYYCSRDGYPFNNLQIYLNGVLTDTILSSAAGWNLYTSVFLYPTLGSNTIIFQGQDPVNDSAIALTKIQFYDCSIIPVATYNTFKPTVIYGYLTLSDYIDNSGKTISAVITTSQLKYNYSILPTYTTSNLGYIRTYSNAATTILYNSFTNSSSIVLPIGIYIVDAYCIFTPSSSAIYTLKLGINLSGGALTTYNYTIYNSLVASVLPQSIRYNFFLTNSTTNTFYFVFNTNLAGNLNGSLNGKFIRIA